MRFRLVLLAIVMVGCVARATPTRYRTIRPTRTPILTDTPWPTAAPTGTATPTHTAGPTLTSSPTFIPSPTLTSAPPTRTPTPRPTATLKPTATPGSSFLRADKTFLAAGECTILRWDVDGFKSVFINLSKTEQQVDGHSSAEICPEGTTLYALRGVKKDGSTQRYYLKITVGACGPTPIISRFDASATGIKRGESVTFFWNVVCAQAVFFKQGNATRQPVNGYDSREAQPAQTTMYRLIVVAQDGSEIKQDITVEVAP